MMRLGSGLATYVTALACACPVWAQDAAPQDTQTVVYDCDRGARISATYVAAATSSVAVLQVEGRQVALSAERSGSGARYGAPEGAGYVWHTKGPDAILFWREAEEEQSLLTRCVEVAE